MTIEEDMVNEIARAVAADLTVILREFVEHLGAEGMFIMGKRTPPGINYELAYRPTRDDVDASIARFVAAPRG